MCLYLPHRPPATCQQPPIILTTTLARQLDRHPRGLAHGLRKRTRQAERGAPGAPVHAEDIEAGDAAVRCDGGVRVGGGKEEARNGGCERVEGGEVRRRRGRRVRGASGTLVRVLAVRRRGGLDALEGGIKGHQAAEQGGDNEGWEGPVQDDEPQGGGAKGREWGEGEGE